MKCTHTKSLIDDPAAPWTFTHVYTKLTLDYIYTPEKTIPGSSTCRVINPELEEANREYILSGSQPEAPYSFLGSWKELSDHYPVFMQFDPPTEPSGNPDNKQKSLNVLKIWP